MQQYLEERILLSLEANGMQLVLPWKSAWIRVSFVNNGRTKATTLGTGGVQHWAGMLELKPCKEGGTV